MNTFSKFFVPLLAAGMLTACSDENNEPGMLPEDGPVEGVSMSITLKLPTTTGGRADAAGNPAGTEVGKAFENNIKEVLLVFADPTTNAFIAQAVSSSLEQDATSKTTYVAKSTFNKSVLINYINSLSSTPDQVQVNVYAFCNPTQEFKSTMSVRTRGDKASTWLNEATTLAADKLDYASVSAAESIPMANKIVKPLSLPSKIDIESGKYAEDYYNLGNINVIRSIARLDYKPGKPNNIYTVPVKTPDGTIDDGLSITLTHMALVNMSKSYFLMHRISTDKTSALLTDTDSKVTIGGDYDDSNIADVDWTWKSTITKTSDFVNHFFYSSTESAESWNRIDLSTLTTEDEDESWAGTEENRKGYKIWRYVTENTIPGEPQNQKTGISTGVVFRGVITANSNTPESFKTTLEGKTEPIYVYKDGNMFASWDDVETEATKVGNENTAIKSAYDACKDITDAAAREAEAVKQGFTIYRYDSKINAYCTLYYYWNRHVDNDLSGVMGENEFGVVRNNIYKLSVVEIDVLGHTRDPKDDPDPVNPENPDEKSDVKIKVSCIVEPWTVRINNIHFN